MNPLSSLQLVNTNRFSIPAPCLEHGWLAILNERGGLPRRGKTSTCEVLWLFQAQAEKSSWQHCHSNFQWPMGPVTPVAVKQNWKQPLNVQKQRESPSIMYLPAPLTLPTNSKAGTKLAIRTGCAVPTTIQTRATPMSLEPY